MTIADTYYADTGETVGQAVKRLHAGGYRIEAAARFIGYTSTDLRLYLERRAIPCPWPKLPIASVRGRPPIKITDEALERYAALRAEGVRASEAAKAVGHPPENVYSAIKRRRPDLKLSRGKRKGDTWSYLGRPHPSKIAC